jgi:hypothetical protein
MSVTSHLKEELKHHGRVDILLGDSGHPDIGTADVEEACAGNVGHRRADLLPRVDHIHTECVHCITPADT